jgi:hypothetical protein
MGSTPMSGFFTGPAASHAKHISRPGFALAPPGRAAVWTRVGLGVLIGAALIQWPYGRGCGQWLGFYLVAVATVVVTGTWGAVFAWKGRLGPAHVIALATVLWGLVLTAQEVLPRVGYAKATATWRCT